MEPFASAVASCATVASATLLATTVGGASKVVSVFGGGPIRSLVFTDQEFCQASTKKYCCQLCDSTLVKLRNILAICLFLPIDSSMMLVSKV